uniref:MD-2-related lipid-recognition domain-containing protein n=1 Tax=viral metagenome TaxID=1070528 RepID=A0A6C0CGU7_9ZZZZ
MSLILLPTILWSAKVCSSADALAKNFAVTLSTDTPTQGQNVTTTFDFDLDSPITGGTAYYSATLNGLGPFTSTANLCDETAKTNDPCPLKAGHHHEESTTENTVTGKVVTQISWYDLQGAEILCAEITTKSS